MKLLATFTLVSHLLVLFFSQFLQSASSSLSSSLSWCHWGCWALPHCLALTLLPFSARHLSILFFVSSSTSFPFSFLHFSQKCSHFFWDFFLQPHLIPFPSHLLLQFSLFTNLSSLLSSSSLFSPSSCLFLSFTYLVCPLTPSYLPSFSPVLSSHSIHFSPQRFSPTGGGGS